MVSFLRAPGTGISCLWSRLARSEISQKIVQKGRCSAPSPITEGLIPSPQHCLSQLHGPAAVVTAASPVMEAKWGRDELCECLQP